MKLLIFISAACVCASFQSQAAPPVRVASIGPNGTHWPGVITTPYLYDAATHDIEVACSWDAIKTAINSIDATKATAGVRIRVRPGTLTGLGSHLGATSVMVDAGSSAWTKRVTVCPRDGYGSVTISGGFKLTRVRGVCWAGFVCNGGFYWVDCDRSALAWTRVGGYSAVHAQATGTTTRNVELCEVVWPEAATDNGDVLQLISNAGAFTGYRLDGLWMAPHYYVNNTDPRPHTDTLQIYRANGGTYANINITLRDSAIFASNNAAFQTGGADGITMTNIVILGAHLGKVFYPVTPGGEDAELFCPMNGAGRNWRSTDSCFYGPMQLSNPGGAYANQPFAEVIRSTLSAASSSFLTPLSGTWTRDANTATYTSRLPAKPTAAFLAKIWSGAPGTVTPPPPPDSDAGTLIAVAGGDWKNLAFPAQTGSFLAAFDMTPSSILVDCVTGLSASTATQYTDLAAAVRFAPNGMVDARNGGSFQAVNLLNYKAGVTYRVQMMVNLESGTYTATFTPPNSAPVMIANNFRFRTEQSNVKSLANLAAAAAIGSQTTAKASVDPTATLGPPPKAPTGLRIVPN